MGFDLTIIRYRLDLRVSVSRKGRMDARHPKPMSLLESDATEGSSMNEALEALFKAAEAVIEQHNTSLTSDVGKVDAKAFLTCVQLSGASSPEALKSFSHEQILEYLPTFKVGNTEVKPFVLAKNIAKAWRVDSTPSDNSDEPAGRIVSDKKAAKMSLPELVIAFDPEEPTNPVAKRLKEISKGQKFIVYSSGRTVFVEATTVLLKEIKQGYTHRDQYEGKETYAIGDLPDNYVDENPLYPGRPLRPDGTCDQTNRSWSGIAKNVRQLVRLALLTKEIDIHSAGGHARANDVLDLVTEGSFDKLCKRYFKAKIQFDRDEKLGALPILLIPLGKPVGIGAGPFDQGERVIWERIAPPPPPKKINPYQKRPNVIHKWTNDAEAYYTNSNQANHFKSSWFNK